MKLFDQLERANRSGAPNERSEFAFLNATAIPMAGHLRDLLEIAFAKYSGDRNELRRRVRATDNKTHLAAVFELMVHELARRRRLKPKADVAVGNGLPDQRIVSRLGKHAFVECRMLEPGNHGLYDGLCDAIDAVAIKGLPYYVRLVSTSARKLSAKRIQSELRQHMETLDRAKLSREFLENKAYAFKIRDEDRTIVEVIPYLKPRSEGGAVIRDGAPDDFVTPEAIRRGLERKSQQYSDAGAPYIIAICSAKSYAEDDDMEEALFREGSGEHRGFFVRSPRAHVSAVLACQRLKPSSFQPRLQLYLNPNATHPLRGNPFGCDLVKRVNSAFVHKSGKSFQDLMRLPANWPAV